MLIVEFIGICTHVLTDGDRWPGPHRVVLPRSQHGHVPHAGFLIIPKDATSDDVQAFATKVRPALEYGETADAYTLLLGGVELSIDNATGDYTREESFNCGIFSARTFARDQPLGAPNPDVAKNRLASRAHAYFDIPHGKLSARLVDNQSSAAVLNVTTEGAPTLRAKAFHGNHEATLALNPMTSLSPPIRITHTTDDADDSHFVMHFEVASNTIINPGWPTEPAPCLKAGGKPVLPGLGPGCSNSTFP